MIAELEDKEGEGTEEEDEEEGQEGEEREREKRGRCEDHVEEEGEYKEAIGKVAENQRREDRKQSPKVSKINRSMKYGRHGTYPEKSITNPERRGKEQTPKMPMESKQLLENGLPDSKRFWNDVLPLYLELK